MVYEGFIEGKISKTREGREIIYLTNPSTKEHKIMSYPKYLMEKHLDRYLGENETIHHKDGNFYNNDFSNLEILDRRIHASNDVKRVKDIIATCAYCGKTFTIKGSSLRYRNRRDRNFHGYFCSKSCVGKYGREIQMGSRTHNENKEKVEREYYKNSQIEN